MRDELVKIKLALNGKEYNFLREHKDLGGNILLLRAGGSYGYGTNVEGSDYDVRGLCGTRTDDLIGLRTRFEQFENRETDTVIYTIDKAFGLLMDCNPNMIELLDNNIEDALYINDIGKLIVDNRKLFISKKAFYTFGGYARGQLNKLYKIVANTSETEEAIMQAIVAKVSYFNNRSSNKIELSTLVDEEGKLLVYLKVDGLRVEEFNGVIAEIASLVSRFNRIGSSNSNKGLTSISKHAMHLIRLYYTCIDILENYDINMYREKEHDILMKIRNESVVDKSGNIREDLLKLAKELDKKMNVAYETSSIPDKPDLSKINELKKHINLELLRRRGII